MSLIDRSSPVMAEIIHFFNLPPNTTSFVIKGRLKEPLTIELSYMPSEEHVGLKNIIPPAPVIQENT